MTSIGDALRGILAGKTVVSQLEEQIVPPVCALCNGLGWLRHDFEIEDPGFGQATPCPLCKPPKPQPSLSEIIPRCALHWEKEEAGCLGCVDMAAAVSMAETFAKGTWPLWVTFLGSLGCGKSALALRMALARKVRGVCVLNSGDFLQELYSAMRADDGPSEHATMLHYQRQPMLVLDDLGRESQTEASRNRIGALLDYRYRNNLPTILTSNLSFPDISNTWPAVASRMMDGRVGVVVQMWNVPDARPYLRPGAGSQA